MVYSMAEKGVYVFVGIISLTNYSGNTGWHTHTYTTIIADNHVANDSKLVSARYTTSYQCT